MSGFKKNDRKGGFIAALLNMLGRGSSAVGGPGSGIGSSGLAGLSGLFSTKAGMLGMALGAATIAAGIGVVYNFIGPSSQPAYGPQLFKDNYYAEQAGNASLERMRLKEASQTEPSTLDLFREQARKEGLGFGRVEKAANEAASPEYDDQYDTVSTESGSPAAAVPSADPGASAPSLTAKLKPAPSFGSGGGGGSSSMGGKAKLSGGGMFDGIMNKFAPVYRPPKKQIKQGQSSAMRGATASIVRGSPKRSLSSGRKGAYGQAKFAGRVGKRAVYSAGNTGARTSATEAFSGETTGTGDVATTGGGGIGVGGAGITGEGLKNSDPSMSSSQYTPPSVTNAEDDSPWKKITDIAMIAMIAGALFLSMGNMLLKQAKAKEKEGTPEAQQQAQALKAMAIAAASAAIAAGAVVIACGGLTALQHDQQWTGLAYALVGVGIIAKGAKIIAAAAQSSKKNDGSNNEENQKEGMEGAAQATGMGTPDDSFNDNLTNMAMNNLSNNQSNSRDNDDEDDK